ncbi:neurotrypsin-like isoform X3 [Halichondria panicea]|uniref:neurotrypsin-like isoform X3 n=1 Tax=Halichondria panicea TaxID=6063 RepID=UPI00312BB586
MRLLFQISVLLLTLQRGTSTDSCLPEDFGKIRLSGQRFIRNEGAVQLCVRYGRSGEYKYLWHYIKTQKGWTDHLRAANLSCKELGLNYTGVTASTVRLTEDAETVTSDVNCNSGDKNLRDCLPDSLSTGHNDEVAGLICNCREGALRLVGGSSHNEGRVEVCSNGRWGTVCGDGWTEREAALVCSRLGYPTLNATLSNFGEGSGPLYDITCRSTGSDDQECIPMITTDSSSCAHVGVRCLLFTDAGAVSSQQNEGATCESSITVRSGSGTLGALVGLLAVDLVVLVVVVVGWIVSCVYFQQKISKHHTHSTSVSTNNPTLQHTPQDEGNQTLYDTINDTATNLEHKEDTVQCVQNESYSLVGQRKTDTLNV